VSRNDRAAFTDQTQAAVTSILEQKGSVDAAWLEGDRLVMRFDDVSQQMQARDAINSAAPREYLIACPRRRACRLDARAGLNP